MFMADFEDSNSPTWRNCLTARSTHGRARGRSRSRRAASSSSSTTRWRRCSSARLAPRGAALPGRRRADLGQPLRLRSLLPPQPRFARQFLLPAEARVHPEARVWNDVFVWTQSELGVPRGTIKATVLIETILAAFEMDEILHELREHSSGLNSGRDYIFSVIKKLGHRPEFVLDRAAVTMAVPFMRAYTDLLADLPPARRARDGRHGGLHPVPPRPRGERGRSRQGARGQGARRDRPDGTCGSPGPRARRAGDLRPRPRRPPQPGRTAAA